MLCWWICDFRIVPIVVFTVWTAWIYILARAYWWGPYKAEAGPRLLGLAQHQHFIKQQCANVEFLFNFLSYVASF